MGVLGAAAGENKILSEFGVRCQLLQIAQAALLTATSVGEEGSNGFAVQLIAFDEGGDRHGEAAPPVGIAKEDNVVFVEISNFCADGRTGVGYLFCFAFGESDAVGFRIRRCQDDFYDVATDLFMDFFSNSFGVAAPGKIGY